MFVVASVVVALWWHPSWWRPCSVCHGGIRRGSIHCGCVCRAGVVFIMLAFVLGFAGVRCAGVAFVMGVWCSSWGSGVHCVGIGRGLCWCLSCGCGVGMVFVIWVWHSSHWYLSWVVPAFVVLSSCWCGVHRTGVRRVGIHQGLCRCLLFCHHAGVGHPGVVLVLLQLISLLV